MRRFSLSGVVRPIRRVVRALPVAWPWFGVDLFWRRRVLQDAGNGRLREPLARGFAEG